MRRSAVQIGLYEYKFGNNKLQEVTRVRSG